MKNLKLINFVGGIILALSFSRASLGQVKRVLLNLDCQSAEPNVKTPFIGQIIISYGTISSPEVRIRDNFASTNIMKCTDDFQKLACTGSWGQKLGDAKLVLYKHPSTPTAWLQRAIIYQRSTARLNCKIAQR